MNYAIVILNWNGEKLLKEFLPSVMEYSKLENTKIYVIDNASQDASIKILKEDFPKVEIVALEKNHGFATGYNKGLKQIKADVYCLLNSDVKVSENWLIPIQEIFENQKNTAIVQPKILAYREPEKFEYAGAAGGMIDALGYPYCRGRLFDSLEEDKGQYDDEKSIFWASGACCFIRAEVYEKLGGLDDSFFAHQEEIDFCWRVHNLGLDVKYTGLSTVYHLGGATLDYVNPKKTYLNFRNNLSMLLKNLPTSHLIPIIFTRLILDGIAGVKFLTQGKFSHILAIIKAHFHFYYRIPKTWEKRKKQNHFSKKYYQHLSIIYSFYFKGKKKI